MRGIHRSPVNSPNKGQWRGALVFSLICAWTSSWVNNWNPGDLRRHRDHYDVTVMVKVRKRSIGSKSAIFFVPCDLVIRQMSLKNNRVPFYVASFHTHQRTLTVVTVRKRPILGQNRRFFQSCDLEIWRMTLKNNRAPLLSNIKLCAPFHHLMWIQTGVIIRKRLSWVLTFDLWPWPFAWTSVWSLVITPENFMMIRWWEHSE